MRTTRIIFYTFFSLLASLSCQDSVSKQKDEIKRNLQQVANWQIANFKYASEGNLHDYGIDSWTNAILYIGMSEWATIAGYNDACSDWLYDVGNTNKWKIPSNFSSSGRYSLYHADEICIGQFYLSMYDKYQEKQMLDPTLERANWIMNNPPDPNMNAHAKQSWTWCDALFMAPPVYAHLANISNDDAYLEFMDKEFRKTYLYLYDKENKLFFRDDSYFDKMEQNGQKVFWGRGNGWVAGGLVNLLKQLPKDSEYRPFYEDLFKEFIPRLAALQNQSGFWHASLLDPDSYPAPETSATALITYAVAYGINQGLLNKKGYTKVVDSAWNALLSVIDENGKLGYVQPIGADPKKVTCDMTAVYGVGVFLLAGCEIYKMN